MKFFINRQNTLARLTLCSSLMVLLCFVALIGSAYAQADTSYRGVGRDPFSRPKPKPPVKAPATPKPVMKPGEKAPPPIQARIDQYRAQKNIDIENNRPVPKITTALLISEIDVTGIVRTPRGYAAMVTPKPLNGIAATIYPGEIFYDGQLVGIEENRLIFRKEIHWTNNKVTTVVEMKQLRQPTKITDPLASAQTSGTGK